MNIQTTEHSIRIAHIALEGRVDAFHIQALQAHFTAQLEAGIVNYVVDLSAVTFLDSAGIAALVSLLKKSRSAGGDVSLVWPKVEEASRILKLTKFDRVFSMFNDATSALQAGGISL